MNFGGGGTSGEHGAVSTGSDDVLRVVQTLMAARIVTGRGFGDNGNSNSNNNDNDSPARRAGVAGGVLGANGPAPTPPTRR